MPASGAEGDREPDTATGRGLKWILPVVALQVAFFSISWNQFFCGDSLYYLSRQTYTWTQVWTNFTREDDVGQYRPLTYPVFSRLLYPVGGLHPRIYHWIGLAIHIAVSLAVLAILNALLLDYRAAIAGYIFFALHSAAYFISYDMTFVSDWLFAGFLLGVIACFLRFLRSGQGRYYLGAVLLFLLALLSKETAVMTPAVLFSLCMVESARRRGDEEARAVPWRKSLGGAIRGTALFAGISLLYLWQVVAVKGRLYPEAPSHPFHLTLDPVRLLKDYKFLLFAFNIDFKPPAQWTEWLPFLIYVPQAILAVWLLLRLSKNRHLRSTVAWLLLWAVALIGPALLLVEPAYPHHLYMPLVAISAMIGLAFGGTERTRMLPSRLVALALVINLAAAYLTIWRFNEKSWVAHGSIIARNFLTSLKRHHPTLAPGSVIHLRKSKEPNSVWYFDRHSLVQLFYRDPSLSMRFEDLGEKLPPQSGPAVPNYFIYGYWDGNLDLLPDYWKGQSVELLEWALQGKVTEDRSQFYPSFEEFRTPNARRVFRHPLILDGERRITLVTIAGTRLRVPLPFIESGSRLHVGLSAVYAEGDGFAGRLLIERDGRRTVLVYRYVDSVRNPADRGWLDYSLDLTRFAGSDNFLILECDAGPLGRTEADWAAWSILRIDKQEEN